LIANPYKSWVSEELEHKRAVLKLAFVNRPAYVRNEGFRTVELALPFKLLESFRNPKMQMARLTVVRTDELPDRPSSRHLYVVGERGGRGMLRWFVRAVAEP
jgi:hypothetical protein